MSCFHMDTLHRTWYSIALKCKTALVHYLAAKNIQGASLVDRLIDRCDVQLDLKLKGMVPVDK